MTQGAPASIAGQTVESSLLQLNFFKKSIFSLLEFSLRWLTKLTFWIELSFDRLGLQLAGWVHSVWGLSSSHTHLGAIWNMLKK